MRAAAAEKKNVVAILDAADGGIEKRAAAEV